MGEGDEDFELSFDDGDPSRPADRPSRRPVGLRGRALPWVALSVVLVLGGVVAAPGPPGEEVGIIDRVAEPMQQWEVDVGFEGMPQDAAHIVPTPEVWLAGQTVLYLAAEEVIALDATDGSEQWRAAGTELRCHLSEPRLLCASGHEDEAELIDLHLDDGEHARHPSPGLVAALALEEDIAAIRTLPQGTVVDRLGPDGDPQWSHLLDPDFPWDEQVPLHTAMEVIGEHLLVALSSASVAASDIVEVSSGASVDLPDDVQLLASSHGPRQGWWGIDSESRIYSVEADGSLSDPLPSPGLMVDDDAHSPVHFRNNERELSAVREGEPLWSREGEGVFLQPLARLDDVLIAAGDDGLLGLDVATGEQRWQLGTPLPQSLFSDGQTLVLFSPDGNEAVRIIGLDAATGQLEFDAAAAGERAYRTTIDQDRLILFTDAGLSLWTW